MRVEVVTPTGAAASREVEEVIAPGALGELGILPGHVALLSALRPGVLTLKGKKTKTKRTLAGSITQGGVGFANKVSVWGAIGKAAFKLSALVGGEAVITTRDCDVE